MLASILYWLIVIFLCMMIIAPLVQIYIDRENPKMDVNVLMSFFTMYCVAFGLSLWLNALNGIEVTIPFIQQQNMPEFAPLLALCGGFSVVVYAFVKASRLRKRRRATHR